MFIIQSFTASHECKIYDTFRTVKESSEAAFILLKVAEMHLEELKIMKG